MRDAIASIRRGLAGHIDDVMEREVFEAVVSREIDAIEDTVYSVYKPQKYERRKSYGGLSDRDNIKMIGGGAKNGVIRVVNATPADMRYPGSTNKDLASLIEYGHSAYCRAHGVGYDFPTYSGKGKYMAPRRFTKSTIDDLRRYGDHIEAFAAGMRRHGFHVT